MTLFACCSDEVSNMLYLHAFDKISSEFCGISHVFVNFAAAKPC